MLQRPQDRLCWFELHPTGDRTVASRPTSVSPDFHKPLFVGDKPPSGACSLATDAKGIPVN